MPQTFERNRAKNRFLGGLGKSSEMSAYEPSYRENVQALIADTLRGLGIPGYRARDVGERVTGLAEWTPFGLLTAKDDATRAAEAGDYTGAALAGLGAVPIVGKAKKAGKAAKELAAPKRLSGFGKDNLTYRDPYSKVVQKTPVELRQAEYEPSGTLPPEKLLKWEDLEGHNIIPLLGDPSRAGQRITGLGGQKFEQGVELPGGPGFTRYGGNWANTASAASTMGNTVAGLGGPTTGVFMKMSPHSVDYAVHMSDVVRQQLKLNPPPKASVEAFDKAMREDWGSVNKKTGKPEYPATKDWPGLENLTDEWIVKHGNDRKKMIKMMDTRKGQDLGMPEIGLARWATTEPELVDADTYTSGYSAIRFDPEGKVVKGSHPTFPHEPVGSYAGRLPEVPIEVLHKEYLETGASGKPILNQYLYKFLLTKPPIIRLGPERIERILKHLKSREGGALGLGGVVAAGLLTQAEADDIRQEL